MRTAAIVVCLIGALAGCGSQGLSDAESGRVLTISEFLADQCPAGASAVRSPVAVAVDIDELARDYPRADRDTKAVIRSTAGVLEACDPTDAVKLARAAE